MADWIKDKEKKMEAQKEEEEMMRWKWGKGDKVGINDIDSFEHFTKSMQQGKFNPLSFEEAPTNISFDLDTGRPTIKAPN